MRAIYERDLMNQLEALGIRRGELLNLKVSMGSIGYVEGGARTLINALLQVIGSRGTIESQAFVQSYPLPLSEIHSREVSDRYSPSYAGALANAMVWYPGSWCSTHPVQRFALIGYRARELAGAHTPESFAYDVLRVMAQEGGRTLKIGTDEKVSGVGTTHVAVELVGLKRINDVQLGVCYFDYRDGQVKTFERKWPSICTAVFRKFAPVYEGVGAVDAKGMIGRAEASITDMGRALDAEVSLLKIHPDFILCGERRCPCCAGWSHAQQPRAYSLDSVLCSVLGYAHYSRVSKPIVGMKRQLRALMVSRHFPKKI